MVRFLIFMGISLLQGLTGFCQSRETLIVKGKIVDDVTGEPVSYATLSLQHNGINTLSNESGQFIFKVPSESSKDSITVSHVGYVPASILIVSSAGGLIIRLKQKIDALEEVKVISTNALELVRQAISKIPENYPQKPYLFKCFYRLTGMKERRIIHMSEAAFEIYNESYSRKNKQVKLLKARFDKDLTAFNGNDEFDFGATPEGILDEDIISNVNESGILSKQGLRNYKFTYQGLVDYNGVVAHEILFDQKEGVRKSLKQGKIIIEAGNLAFLQFTSRLSPRGLKYWKLGFAKKMVLKLSRISIDLLQDSSIVTYRKYGNRYYLNHVKGSGYWHIIGGKGYFELNPFRLKNNYLITGIDTANVQPFDRRQVFQSSGFIENSTRKNDSQERTDTFWDDYNLIQPEFDVDSVARVIRENNEVLNYKSKIETNLPKYAKDRSVRIDSVFSFYARLGKFNGNALVQYKGEIIYRKSFGMADREMKIPNQVQTQFRIGSASKQFTAMVIMQLVGEKKLNVMDTVGSFLKGYIHGRVTIQQLLTHQSGIPNYTDNQEYLAMTMARTFSSEELVRQFCSDSLEFEPGTQFHYSNSGYVILAAIIEKITGEKYADVLADKIFKPLKMTGSFFGSVVSATPDLAVGYVNEQPEMAYAVENIVGAGGITSTADDLLAWNRALSADVLLPDQLMKEIFQSRVEWREWTAGYGYGWMIDRLAFRSSRNHEVQYHPGTEPGFYTMIVRQPDSDMVIILLSNMGEFPRFDITDIILTELNR